MHGGPNASPQPLKGAMISLLRTAAAVVVANLILTGHVHAGPLLVQSGGFNYEGDPFGWVLDGEGFSLRGGGSFPIASVLNSCASLPCTPGSSIELSSILGGNLTPGSLGYGAATIDGSTFGDPVNGPYVLFGGTLRFDAPSVIFPGAAGIDSPLVLTAPFSLRGNVAGFDESAPGAALFQAEFTGRGTVTLRGLYDGDSYFLRGVTYDFAPVPEPATLLLLGAGAAMMTGRRWLRRRCGGDGAWISSEHLAPRA